MSFHCNRKRSTRSQVRSGTPIGEHVSQSEVIQFATLSKKNQELMAQGKPPQPNVPDLATLEAYPFRVVPEFLIAMNKNVESAQLLLRHNHLQSDRKRLDSEMNDTNHRLRELEAQKLAGLQSGELVHPSVPNPKLQTKPFGEKPYWTTPLFRLLQWLVGTVVFLGEFFAILPGILLSNSVDTTSLETAWETQPHLVVMGVFMAVTIVAVLIGCASGIYHFIKYLWIHGIHSRRSQVILLGCVFLTVVLACGSYQIALFRVDHLSAMTVTANQDFGVLDEHISTPGSHTFAFAFWSFIIPLLLVGLHRMVSQKTSKRFADDAELRTAWRKEKATLAQKKAQTLQDIQQKKRAYAVLQKSIDLLTQTAKRLTQQLTIVDNAILALYAVGMRAEQDWNRDSAQYKALTKHLATQAALDRAAYVQEAHHQDKPYLYDHTYPSPAETTTPSPAKDQTDDILAKYTFRTATR